MDRNKMLLDFASDWTLDGDLLRCRECERAQIASRQDEDFVHRSDCKKLRIGGRPWTVLQAILLTLPSGVSVVDQLAAVTAQRDELLRDLRVAVQMIREADDRSAKTDEKRGLCSSPFCNGNHHDSACEGDYMTRRWLESADASIARAQPEQPQQPPTQQPMVAEPPIQSGECSFLDQLPKGPALGRFSASERAELDELKRKAFKAGEP